MRQNLIKITIKATVCLVYLYFLPLNSQAQNTSNPPQPGDRPPRQIDRTEDSQSMTVEQKTQVKSILSKYNESSLTAAEAEAINEAFRNAGLRNGPALQQAIREAGFVPERIGALAPPPGSAGRQERIPPDHPQSVRQDKGPGGDYSIEQAISDRAQLSTIAFDGLAFLTGDFGCNTFLPPGKVADYCGFQYMRDVDKNQLGHNTSFVPRAANNVLHILTDEQKTQLILLGKEQENLLTDFVTKRFPLIKAFCRQLAGDIPAVSAGLNREAVMKYTSQFYEIDGLLSYRRAQVLGGIVRSLTDQQKVYLAKMVFSNSATWPELPDQIDRRSLSHTAHVAVMTYASEMFSWYAGSVDADVYFCPERHGTYFGSFYMKDIPAMGNNNYSISTSLTGDSGEAFLAALTDEQRKLVTNLVDQQRQDLNEIVATRRAIATELRQFMKEDTIDKDKLMALSRKYGELDGEISYYYCMAFAHVAKTLTAEQKQTLLKLRNLDAKYTSKGAYMYSQAIEMPDVPNTDFLFTAPANASFTLSSPDVADGGDLPKDYTGDGTSSTLPLEWSGAPSGTQSYAIIMHHIDPEGVTKWYWILYNIPADVHSLPKNVKGIGILGNNSIDGQVSYTPPHSKGPGPKTYIYTLYALSAPMQLAIQPEKVNRDVLLTAMKDHILASAELKVVYTRKGDGDGPSDEQLGRGNNRSSGK
jgi:Raf kinase inhibitor-like YbhB/YbcL family protein